MGWFGKNDFLVWNGDGFWELIIYIIRLFFGEMIFYIPKLGSDIGKINFFIRKLGLFDKILDKKVLKIAKNMKFKIYSTKEDKIRQK